MATYFMNLTLPVPRVTASTTWATNLNTALTTADAHNHTSGFGQRITSAGLDIDDNIDMSEFNFTSLGGVKLTSTSSTYGTDNSVYVKNGELYFVDGSSNDIAVTVGGSLAISGFGSIFGDYASTNATVSYDDTSKSYLFQDSNSQPARLEVGPVVCTTIESTSTNTLTTLTANSTASLQATNITNTTTVSGDATFTGNVTGRGIIPIGAVIGYAANLSGIGTPAGMVALDGSTIDDEDSPMDGVTLPNINDSVFLMGSSTAGTTGGANSYALSEAQLPSHVHTINHGHSNTFSLDNSEVASSTHTHNISHIHEWLDSESDWDSGDDGLFYNTKNSSDPSSTSIDETDSTVLKESILSKNNNPGSTDYMTAADDPNNVFFTTGVLDAPTGTGSSAVSGAASTTTELSLSGQITDTAGEISGATGSGSSIDSRPAYISTVFYIRIK